jgi:hypothetical protein
MDQAYTIYQFPKNFVLKPTPHYVSDKIPKVLPTCTVSSGRARPAGPEFTRITGVRKKLGELAK